MSSDLDLEAPVKDYPLLKTGWKEASPKHKCWLHEELIKFLLVCQTSARATGTTFKPTLVRHLLTLTFSNDLSSLSEESLDNELNRLNDLAFQCAVSLNGDWLLG